MRFSIFTHVIHKLDSGKIFAYSPYVKEMNYWISNVDQVIVVSPVISEIPNAIETSYLHDNLKVKSVPGLYFKNFFSGLKSLFRLFPISLTIFREMKISNHIHIRCPGNIGLLACIVQILFPKKPKTIKYAGNWDPKSEQPFSYKFQKWIISNTFLTKNTKVLVYGKWGNQSNNITPFFTATYSESDKLDFSKKFEPPFRFVFVGSLVEGKRPLLAVKIIHELIHKNLKVRLDIFGDGNYKKMLEEYIYINRLNNYIKLRGIQNAKTLKNAYIDSHFSILPSKSEGWPKALAEAMFYGCIPIATNVSCVEDMLAKEGRGILIKPSVELAAEKLFELFKHPKRLKVMSEKAKVWSHQFTIEKFQKEISHFL